MLTPDNIASLPEVFPKLFNYAIQHIWGSFRGEPCQAEREGYEGTSIMMVIEDPETHAQLGTVAVIFATEHNDPRALLEELIQEQRGQRAKEIH
jgi:hypothetical protein